MSLNELEVIASFMGRAVCPEDVFGEIHNANDLKKSYRLLAKALHPDMHVGDAKAISLAQHLFQELETLHKDAKDRITKGTYGKKIPLPNKVPIIIKARYVRERSFAAGDIADIHLSSLESAKSKSDLLLKVARKSADNDLLRAERDVLEALHKHPRFSKSDWNDCIPTISDAFLLDTATGKKCVNVLRNFQGFYDVEFIHHRIPLGIDGRTVAWMWKRLLILLDWTYKIGFIHGAVLPPHVMFYPDNDGKKFVDKRKHSVRLIDWAYAIDHKKRTRLSAWVPKWEDFYAPEVLAKKPLGPWTDLYMGAKTMLYLVGGDVKKNGFPDHIPAEIITSISQCLHKTTAKRPQDIKDYFDSFNATLKKVYGAPRYHDFVVPGI